MMSDKDMEKIVWMWVTFLGRPANRIAELLFQEFGSLQAAWEAAGRKELPEGILAHGSLAEKLTDPRARDCVMRSYEMIDRLGVSVTTVSQPDYPGPLLSIYSRPLVLYYFGRLPASLPEPLPLLAVVGSRNATAYGRSAAFRLCRSLAESGIGIVSGLARGIDGQAHNGALAANGYTIAVLGGGPDHIYPPEHRKLYEQVKQEGCVLSEYVPGTEPMRSHFPARNRIIAGLCQGTLVCEAKRSSGAMITVERTLEEGRDVYAVPGNIDCPNSEGCNQLIRSGAVCVTGYQDVLEGMGYSSCLERGRQTGWLCGLTGAEYAVAQAISQGIRQEESLFCTLEYPTAELQCALTMLEIKGFIRKGSTGEYDLFDERKT